MSIEVERVVLTRTSIANALRTNTVSYRPFALFVLHRAEILVEPFVDERDLDFGGWDVAAFEEDELLWLAEEFEERFALGCERGVFVVAAVHH
jgi:hypothetical protein